MNRRDFLKKTAGFTFGLAATSLTLPTKAKCKIAAPVTDVVANQYLDRHIQANIKNLKSQNPHLKIGETHCHTLFSDGNFSVKELMVRAASLGLDFIVITEHMIPRKYSLENSFLSFNARFDTVNQWSHATLPPITAYPAFEVSTNQGHLILVFPEDFLNPRLYKEIKSQFSPFESGTAPMAYVAEQAKQFGAISIIPHPAIERSYPFGVSIAFAKEHLTGLVDAIEDISTGHGYRENFSGQLDMAAIGSSDDHFNMIIGTSVTGYDSRLHPDFISAVKAKQTEAIMIEDSLHHFFSAARVII